MKKKVIIAGGGIAGMSAAHELIERGFDVEIYEKNRVYAGGKARSVNVPGTNKPDPTLYLPGEHGFRFFPGFYKHIIDTLKRIPYLNNKDGVLDNLVKVERVGIQRFGKNPIVATVSFPKSLADVKALIKSMHADTGLTEEEKMFFSKKVWQLMTTCYDRRINEYERIGWWDYMESDRFSENYQALLVQGLTRTLVAANAKKASTKTGGDIFLQLIFNMTNSKISTDRVLNGPTSDVWIDPWLAYLVDKGVKYHRNYSAVKLEMKDGKVEAVCVQKYQNGVPEQTLVSGDYYILAVPVEVADKLLSKEVIEADPTLEGISKLARSVSWMNGIQFYLSEAIDVVKGHCIYSDSPWALTSISQLLFWKDYNIDERFNGKVKGILSVDISDWETPGILDSTGGKIASHCSYKEIKNEVWAQLKQSLNVNGKDILSDDHLVHWYVDHDITIDHQHQDTNKEPLLVNTINSWNLRPQAYTRIPNLYLASDYVQTFTDLATMEGANEAARRAVNAIIENSGARVKKCKVWNLHEPEILKPMRARDQKRYNQGLPYLFQLPVWVKILEAVLLFIRKVTGRK